MARGITFALLIVAAAAACVGEDPDPVPTTPAPGPDAGDPGSAGSGDNLLGANGGFENGCGAPFFSSSADLTSEPTTAKSGGKSCKVCRKADSADADYSIFAYVDVEPKAGDVFTVSAQMRRVLNVEPGSDGLISVIAMDSMGSQIDTTGDSKNTPAVVDEWKQASVTWTVPANDPSAGSSRLRVQLGLATSDSGNCFLVDDFVVTKQK